MKKKSATNRTMLGAFALMMFSLVFTSCEKVTGEGPVVTQQRTLQPFKSLSAGISGRIRYTVAPVYKVELQAQQNILDIIETTLAGDELMIKFRNGINVRRHDEIIINISAPSPEAVTISGDASFDLDGPVTGDQLNLRVSGSGSIQVNEVELASKLEAVISGSGNINVLKGVVQYQSAKISGSGNVQTTGVASKIADTEISGSGNIRLKVAEKLHARISGSGSVYYAGTPQVTASMSGSGAVRPL